jgi:hypothetical protein
MKRRMFIVQRGERFLTGYGGSTKYVAKAYIWPTAEAAKDAGLPNGCKLVPVWVDTVES